MTTGGAAPAEPGGAPAEPEGAPVEPEGAPAESVPVEPALPEAVRLRVIAVAATVLGGLAPEEIPAALRTAARFTPAKRARLAAPALATALSTDAGFRARVAEAATADSAGLAGSLHRGAVPAAADPVEVGVLAYLTRPAGWAELIVAVRADLDQAGAVVRAEQAGQETTRLRTQLDRAREDLRAAQQQARAESKAARAELDNVRRQLRELNAGLRTAERAADTARTDLADIRTRAAAADSAAQGELRRLRQRLTETQTALEDARRSGREARGSGDARLWLLLETLTGTVQGLRRELALSPAQERPADSVADPTRPDPAAPAARGDDPGHLDRLLSLPRAHLIVDGYNVTKTGYGELPLERQRTRLVAGLAGLAAQTRAEVTCVFDGAGRPLLQPPTPRGVRVVFSEPGQTADALILAFVAAEPQGRPVVVVSADREVADGARRHGGWPVPSAALVARLDRT